jgi:hypothetical protein
MRLTRASHSDAAWGVSEYDHRRLDVPKANKLIGTKLVSLGHSS